MAKNLKLGIDAREAISGARQYDRATETIERSARDATRATDKLNKSVAQTGRGAGGAGRAGGADAGGAGGGRGRRGGILAGVGAGLAARAAGVNPLLVGGAAAAGGLFRGFQITQQADRLQKLNLKIGASVEFLSEMGFAASQSGIQFEEFAKSFEKFQFALEEFRQKGTGQGADALAALSEGFAEQVRAGKPVEDLYLRLADEMRTLTREQRSFVAGKLFGLRGASQLQLLSGGSAGVGALRAEANRLGATRTQEFADTSAKLNDEFEKLGVTLDAMIASITRLVQPALITFAETATGVANGLRDPLGANSADRGAPTSAADARARRKALQDAARDNQLRFNFGQTDAQAARIQELRDIENSFLMAEAERPQLNGAGGGGGGRRRRFGPNPAGAHLSPISNANFRANAATPSPLLDPFAQSQRDADDARAEERLRSQQDQLRALREEAREFGDTLSSSFINAAFSAGTFEDRLNSILDTLTRFAAEKVIGTALSRAGSGIFESTAVGLGFGPSARQGTGAAAPVGGGVTNFFGATPL